MSGVNPAEVIAEALYDQESSGDFTKRGQGGYPYTDCDALAEHVVSVLAASGHTIVSNDQPSKTGRFKVGGLTQVWTGKVASTPDVDIVHIGYPLARHVMFPARLAVEAASAILSAAAGTPERLPDLQ